MNRNHEDIKRDHPDLPEEAARNADRPEGHPGDGIDERDYVAHSTVQGDGIYDESLFADEKEPIPPSDERNTALTPADTQVPATHKPEDLLARPEPREEPKQVLPGNHDLTDEEFSQVAEHPNPLDETELQADPDGVTEGDIDAYIRTIGKDKNMTRLDKAIEERAGEPEPEHPHMHDSADFKEKVEREKDKEMNEADLFNVFKQSRYRGDQ